MVRTSLLTALAVAASLASVGQACCSSLIPGINTYYSPTSYQDCGACPPFSWSQGATCNPTDALGATDDTYAAKCHCLPHFDTVPLAGGQIECVARHNISTSCAMTAWAQTDNAFNWYINGDAILAGASWSTSLQTQVPELRGAGVAPVQVGDVLAFDLMDFGSDWGLMFELKDPSGTVIAESSTSSGMRCTHLAQTTNAWRMPGFSVGVDWVPVAAVASGSHPFTVPTPKTVVWHPSRAVASHSALYKRISCRQVVAKAPVVPTPEQCCAAGGPDKVFCAGPAGGLKNVCATLCDGATECASGEDELDCSYITPIATGTGEMNGLERAPGAPGATLYVPTTLALKFGSQQDLIKISVAPGQTTFYPTSVLLQDRQGQRFRPQIVDLCARPWGDMVFLDAAGTLHRMDLANPFAGIGPFGYPGVGDNLKRIACAADASVWAADATKSRLRHILRTGGKPRDPLSLMGNAPAYPDAPITALDLQRGANASSVPILAGANFLLATSVGGKVHKFEDVFSVGDVAAAASDIAVDSLRRGFVVTPEDDVFIVKVVVENAAAPGTYNTHGVLTRVNVAANVPDFGTAKYIVLGAECQLYVGYKRASSGWGVFRATAPEWACAHDPVYPYTAPTETTFVNGPADFASCARGFTHEPKWTPTLNAGVAVTSAGHGDPYKGDTCCSADLPVLCVADAEDPTADPQPALASVWSGKRLNLTGTVAGTSLTSRRTADELCCATFGNGWRMGSHSDFSWDGHALGDVARWAPSRYWVAIDDQPGNCWGEGQPPADDLKCHTDCQGQWSQWSACVSDSTKCKAGIRFRVYHHTQRPTGNGAACPYPDEYRETEPCEVPGLWINDPFGDIMIGPNCTSICDVCAERTRDQSVYDRLAALEKQLALLAEQQQIPKDHEAISMLWENSIVTDDGTTVSETARVHILPSTVSVEDDASQLPELRQKVKSAFDVDKAAFAQVLVWLEDPTADAEATVADPPTPCIATVRRATNSLERLFCPSDDPAEPVEEATGSNPIDSTLCQHVMAFFGAASHNAVVHSTRSSSLGGGISVEVTIDDVIVGDPEAEANNKFAKILQTKTVVRNGSTITSSYTAKTTFHNAEELDVARLYSSGKIDNLRRNLVRAQQLVDCPVAIDNTGAAVVASPVRDSPAQPDRAAEESPADASPPRPTEEETPLLLAANGAAAAAHSGSRAEPELLQIGNLFQQVFQSAGFGVVKLGFGPLVFSIGAPIAIFPINPCTIIGMNLRAKNQYGKQRLHACVVAAAQPFYDSDLCRVRWKNRADATFESTATTVGYDVFFPWNFDVNFLGAEGHLRWLVHELTHVDQYRSRGGLYGFCVVYQAQVLTQVGNLNFINMHDALPLEIEADQRVTDAADQIWADLQQCLNSPTGLPANDACRCKELGTAPFCNGQNFQCYGEFPFDEGLVQSNCAIGRKRRCCRGPPNAPVGGGGTPPQFTECTLLGTAPFCNANNNPTCPNDFPIDVGLEKDTCVTGNKRRCCKDPTNFNQNVQCITRGHPPFCNANLAQNQCGGLYPIDNGLFTGPCLFGSMRRCCNQ